MKFEKHSIVESTGSVWLGLCSTPAEAAFTEVGCKSEGAPSPQESVPFRLASKMFEAWGRSRLSMENIGQHLASNW